MHKSREVDLLNTGVIRSLRKQPFFKRLVALWHLLTASHPSIKDEEEVINSKLLSGYIVTILPIGCLFLVLLRLSDSTGNSSLPDVVIFGILFSLMLVIYWINRAGHFQLSIKLILFLGCAFIMLEAVLDNDILDSLFLLLPVIAAGLFLPMKYLVLSGIFNICGVLLLLLIPSVKQTYLILAFIIPFLVMSFIIIITARIHRDNLEVVRSKRVAVSEFRYALAASAVNDGLWDWDIQKDEIYYSPRWKTMLGFQEYDIGNHPDEWYRRIHPEDLGRFHADIKQHLNGRTKQLELEYRALHADGTYRWMLCRGLAARDTAGVAYRMAGSQTDITDRKLAEAQLAFNAMHDALTGLPNRLLFLDRLKQRLEYGRRHPEHLFAVLFIDLDRFKVINDSLGHAVGDHFLIGSTNILKNCVRPEDTCARMGGDEFAILLNDIHQASDALRVAERIHQRMSEITIPEAINRSSTASIGIVLYTDMYKNPDDMLRDADTAMYQAKAQGGGRHQVFDTEMYNRAVAVLQLETELKQAVINREWEVHYQPIVSVRNGKILGVEALLRWHHPTRGIVYPLDFMLLAEESGLVIPIGEYVLNAACQQVMAWQEAQFPDLWVSVNLSGRQFQSRNLIEMIKKTLIKTGLPSDRLQLEITETVAMQDLAHSTRVLHELRALGVRVSLDDFGTGHSSLNYLKQLPIDVLKIDRSFINDIEVDQNSEAITAAIVSLGHTLNCKVVAEGVENEKQFAFLNSIFCDEAQGYLFSKPLPADELCQRYKGVKSFVFLQEAGSA